MAGAAPRTTFDIDGHQVVVTNPDKVLFPALGLTKLDLVNYYRAVADGALRAAGGRPNVLVRHPTALAASFSSRNAHRPRGLPGSTS